MLGFQSFRIGSAEISLSPPPDGSSQEDLLAWHLRNKAFFEQMVDVAIDSAYQEGLLVGSQHQLSDQAREALGVDEDVKRPKAALIASNPNPKPVSDKEAKKRRMAFRLIEGGKQEDKPEGDDGGNDLPPPPPPRAA